MGYGHNEMREVNSLSPDCLPNYCKSNYHSPFSFCVHRVVSNCVCLLSAAEQILYSGLLELSR